MDTTTPPTATLSDAELLREPAPWRYATLDETAAYILSCKGIRFTGVFSPTLMDIEPPYRIERDSRTGDIKVWQPT